MSSTSKGIPPQLEFTHLNKKLERLAQVGVQREIASQKAKGHSIFYSRNGVPIMEQPDGRCFEYKRLKDGTREIIREVEPRSVFSDLSTK
jgi:hypothetical protein